jgi:hypothetical protein
MDCAHGDESQSARDPHRYNGDCCDVVALVRSCALLVEAMTPERLSCRVRVNKPSHGEPGVIT